MAAASICAAPLDITYATPNHRPWQRHAIRLFERASGQRRLVKLYNEYVAQNASGDFFENAISGLDLFLKLDGTPLSSLPREGPLLFVANHPFGVLDGLVLAWLARRVRADAKVMAIDVLCAAPGSGDALLPIDFSHTREALRTNTATRRAAMTHLVDGGALGLFPGGGVSTVPKPYHRTATDPLWHPFAGKLLRRSGATVVPVFFEGQNSRLFQMASHASPLLRSALFLRETRRMVGGALTVSIGAPLAASAFDDCADRLEISAKMRAKTYALAPSRKAGETVFTYPRRYHLDPPPRRLTTASI